MRLNPARRHRFLVAGMLVWAAGYLFFYPPTTAVVDEHAYLTQSYLFRSGHLSYDGSPVPVAHQSVDCRAAGGHVVSKYPPGNGLWLLPFTLPGWRWVFVSGLVLAMAGTLLLAAILSRLRPEADPSWALLFLCYPAVTVFSRTVMSDIPATVAVLAAFYLLLLGRGFLVGSGALLGLACLFRYPMLVFLLPFALILLWQQRQSSSWVPGRRGRKPGSGLMLLLAGFIPFALLILAYNNYAYGSPLRVPLSAGDRFSPAYLGRNLLYYGINLTIWYPLLIIGPVAAGRGHRIRLVLPALALLLLYGCFSYIHQESLAERLVLGMRYLLPALPFFVVGYAIAAERLLSLTGISRVLVRAVLGLLIVGALGLQWRHQRFLQIQARYQELLYAALPEDAILIGDKEVSEMINVAWGWRDNRYYGWLNPDTLPPDRPLFAAALMKPGRVHPEAMAELDSLLQKFPGRTLVLNSDRPYRFWLYRLR
ncbi:MAG: hypothetical protein ABIK43_01790 [candidate division WOR-3 bacterium]